METGREGRREGVREREIGREREGELFHLLVQFLSVYSDQDWTEQKLGAGNSIRAPYTGRKDPPVQPSTLPWGVCTGRKVKFRLQPGIKPKN